jgi:hypothetical protein
MKKHQFGFTITGLVVCIIFVMTVPPVIALAGTMTGTIGNDCSECRIHQDVHVERVSNQSIKITYTSKVPATNWIGHYEPAVIKVNGKDVSTQSEIQQQDIGYRIEPAEGLSYREESTVVLTGEEVSVNRSHPIQVVIISYNGSPGPIILYNKTVDQ